MKKQKEAKNSLYFFLFFFHFLSETGSLLSVMLVRNS